MAAQAPTATHIPPAPQFWTYVAGFGRQQIFPPTASLVSSLVDRLAGQVEAVINWASEKELHVRNAAPI